MTREGRCTPKLYDVVLLILLQILVTLTPSNIMSRNENEKQAKVVKATIVKVKEWMKKEEIILLEKRSLRCVQKIIKFLN